MRPFLFTSESVTEGHPDKVADRISDAVLDAVFAQDPKGRVACETLVTTGLVMVAGEITTSAQLDYVQIARDAVKDIGYDDPSTGFDYRSCGVLNVVNKQSPDIAMGVDSSAQKEQGAGDQGLMFGFACNETDELMPMPIMFAHRLTKRLAEVRKNGTLPWLRPDGKSQVTVRYEQEGKPQHVDAVVISTQHTPEMTQAQIREAVIEEVIKKVIPADLLATTRYFINPTGQFIVGGPHGDCGLTGRKIIVDTYGGAGRHGGGAFSGKDPSKVDRSAAYMARYVAKNIVAAGLADRCEVQLAYAIGVAEPVSVHVNTFGTEKIDPDKIEDLVRKHFEMKPAAIISTLDLLKPIYQPSAAYGHFGRKPEEGGFFTWERTNKAEALAADAGITVAR